MSINGQHIAKASSFCPPTTVVQQHKTQVLASLTGKIKYLTADVKKKNSIILFKDAFFLW